MIKKGKAMLTEVELEVELAPVKKRKQVGILGGNFNPVHLTHLIIADQVFAQLGLDKVYLMPSYESPHVDPKKTISAQTRIEMLSLAVADSPHLEIETIEITRGGKSFTYDTMLELTKQNPDTDYYFIIGGDMVAYLPKWYKITELLELVQFVAVRRPEYPTETPYPVIWVDVPLMDLSSTMIRKKINDGCTVRYLLPQNVINYIEEKRLYRDEE